VNIASDLLAKVSLLSPSCTSSLSPHFVLTYLPVADKYVYGTSMYACMFSSSTKTHNATDKHEWTRLPVYPVMFKTSDFCCYDVCSATRIGFLRHGITRDASLLVLKRRTGPPSKSLYKTFVDTYAAKNVPAHVSSCHGASWTRRYLLVLRFSSQHSRGLFIRVLNNINASMGRDALKYLLQEVLYAE
jgi:hypothetical protein